MKIAINVLGLSTVIAGAERYCKTIIQDLTRMDQDNEYILILSKHNVSTYGVKQDNVTNLICPINTNKKWRRVLYEQYQLPRLLRKRGVNVLFSPCNISPSSKHFRKVTMIFDMHFFVENKHLSPIRLAYIRCKILHSAKVAEHILTISEHSKQDIVTYAKVPEGKITVTFLGPTPLFSVKDQVKAHSMIEHIKQEQQIKKPYVLFIGQLLYRKNVELVIQAMHGLKQDGRELPFQFVVAGNWDTHWKSYRVIVDLITKMDLKDDVVFVNHPSDRVLGDLLYHAWVFVYPSLYEGFGLPVVEALHYGVPTITSNVSSLPEVGLDACYYVDPRSVKDMKEALWKVWHDEGLRSQMIRKGERRIEILDWEASVCKTHDILTGGTR